MASTLAPFKPLPVGMSEYTLTIVLGTEREAEDLATDAVLAMITSGAALRQSKAQVREGLTTLRVRYGATSDTHAHAAAAGAVQMAHRAGMLNGVTVMAGSRFVVAAHATLV